jgi:hypothetical protein
VPFALGLAWAIGYGASKDLKLPPSELLPSYTPPPSARPPESQTVVNNNAIARAGFIADLDGTAIAYTAEADRLFVDGRFRLDLPLADLAKRLGRGPESRK